MDTITQVVTIAAVVLGSLTSYVTSQLMARSKHKQRLRTRWDEKKLDAYADYIGRVRANMHAAVLLYEVRQGMRALPSSQHELTLELAAAGGAQALAFERVMLLAGDAVIEHAHGVQKAVAAIEWQARGVVDDTLESWRGLHVAAFQAINRFHEAARVDLGVTGSFEGDQHTARGLLLPRAQTEEPTNPA